MRVLIAARHSPAGTRINNGVATWCKTVGDVLLSRGHEVVYWEPGHKLEGMFDLGILSNFCDTRYAATFCTKNISISHGVIPPEKPSARNAVFTSEGNRDHWRIEGPVIRQPIDLKFWTPLDNKPLYLTRFTYRHGLEFVPQIARKMHVAYKHLRLDDPLTVREILRRSVCVLATGRASLEAMACGAPVVLVDDREYQKPFMDLDLLHAMENNYSGRGGITPTFANVSAAIDRAVKVGSLRAHVEKYHDADVVVDQLLGVVA